MSQLELTEKELEILIRLLSEDITKDEDKKGKFDNQNYNDDEVFLLK